MLDLGDDNAIRGYSQLIETYRDNKQWQQATDVAEEAAKKFPNDRGLQMMAASQQADMGNARTDTQAAKTSFLVRQALGKGVLSRGKCLKPPLKGHAHGRSCTRFKSLGSFSHADAAEQPLPLQRPCSRTHAETRLIPAPVGTDERVRQDRSHARQQLQDRQPLTHRRLFEEGGLMGVHRGWFWGEAQAEARLGIAVARGLLLDVLATGDVLPAPTGPMSVTWPRRPRCTARTQAPDRRPGRVGGEAVGTGLHEPAQRPGEIPGASRARWSRTSPAR